MRGAAGGVPARAVHPVVPSGPVYDIFTKQRAQWHTITIDAFDTPNLKCMCMDEKTQEAHKASGLLRRRAALAATGAAGK